MGIEEGRRSAHYDEDGKGEATPETDREARQQHQHCVELEGAECTWGVHLEHRQQESDDCRYPVECQKATAGSTSDYGWSVGLRARHGQGRTRI